MGLHTGEPALGSEGYLGLDVVRAARICTAAKGGNVLLSETTRSLVGSSLPEGVSVFPLGERQLKDIDQPEQVYELAIDGVERQQRRRSPCPPTRPTPSSATSLKASIQQRVDRELRAALESSSRAEASDDESVDELAGRTAGLGDVIAARVEAALREAQLADGVDRAGVVELVRLDDLHQVVRPRLAQCPPTHPDVYWRVTDSPAASPLIATGGNPSRAR